MSETNAAYGASGASRKALKSGRGVIPRTAGAFALAFLVIQAVSGVLLAFNYHPTIEDAHASVVRIATELPFGWFIRSVHVWSSHLLIASGLVWFWSKYFLRTYRESSYAKWSSTLCLILILGAFGFTGMLLPWDVVGFHATQIGAGIAGAVPLVGGWLSNFLMAGAEIPNDATVARMFSLHAVALPLLAVLLAFYRLFGGRFSGGELHGRRESGGGGVEGGPMEGPRGIEPAVFRRGMLAGIIGAMALLTLVLFFPSLPGPPADPLGAAPEGIRPAWYFLPVFLAIRSLPGTIWGVETDAWISTALILGIALLFMLPRLDREGGGTFIRLAGGVIVAYMFVSIITSLLTI